MKVLVTGGGGFLGSKVIQTLIPSHEVDCLDHGKNYKFLDLYFKKKVKFIKGDSSDEKILMPLIKKADAIIHLAGVVGERRCIRDPLKSNISNIYSTYKILDIAKNFNIKKIIFSSSYWVYSSYKKRKMPLLEDSKLNTDSVYGAQKVLSELFIRNSSIPFDILRISAIYGFGTGVGSQWEGIVGNFIKQAFKKEPITVYGTGKQKIDLVYVDDIAQVIKDLIQDEKESNIYNIGGGKPTSILEIVSILEDIFKKDYGIKLKLKIMKAPPGKIWPDKWLLTKNIERKYDQYPFTTLQDGIKKTITAFEPYFLRK